MDIVSFDHFNKSINNIDIEILEHGYFTGGTDWSFRSMSSPFNRLYFALDGEAYISNADEKVILHPGKIYFIPRNSVYDYYCEKYMVQFYIHFRINLFNILNVFSPFNKCIALPYSLSDTEQFVNCAKSENIQDILRCKSILYSIISRIISEFPETTAQAIGISLKYKELDRFLMDHCKAGIYARDAAGYLNCSEFTLKKNFKADTGISLNHYITNAVMQSAREMLTITDLKIKEIAFALGYTDEFYFSRCFRKNTGISPREYRLGNRI